MDKEHNSFELNKLKDIDYHTWYLVSAEVEFGSLLYTLAKHCWYWGLFWVGEPLGVSLISYLND